MELQKLRKLEAGVAGSHYYTLSGAEIRQNFPALLKPRLSQQQQQGRMVGGKLKTEN